METGPYAVVVVDDAADVRALVGRQLGLSRHFTVVGEGATGAEAVALAAAHRPALMVLDASMPDMDGLEALPAVLAASPETQIVMFSGFGGAALEAAARALGAAAFVEKATPLRELPDRLLRVLGAAGSPSAVPAGADDALSPDSQAELAEHLERFRTVFDQAAIGMATMTLGGTVVRVNHALVRLTGEAEAALVGWRYYDLTGSGADDDLRDALARVAGGKEEAAEVEHRLRVQGTTVRVRSTLTVVRDPRGRPLYIFAQAEDVTAARQTLEELRASEERFRLLVESVIDYAIFMLDPGGYVTTWNIGAETRAAELLAEHWNELNDSERVETMGNLTSSARRTRRLLDELLMASRLEAGQLEVRLEPVPLAAAIAEAVSGSEAAVTVTGDGADVVVRADRVRVVQVLGNLLTNAGRYGRPPVTVETRVDGDVVQIRVCDAGDGVPAELEPRLFRKFVRGAGRRDRGAGLGLFIVRQLSRRQGGDAWYERDAAGRPCFCFTLPREG